MSAVSLPNHATLRSMRREARLLQAGFLAGRNDAAALVARHHPGHPGNTLPLHAAQLVVARAHGFSSWSKLKHYFDAAADLRFDGGPEPAAESLADRFCRLATLTYDNDDPMHQAAAREFIATHPDLARGHIWAAASATDLSGVRRQLQSDPTLATARGGPHGWTPLYYLAFSRVDPASPDALPIAAMLLDSGANANEGYLWAGQPTPFTLLTGVFGEGELGPERQPRHPQALALARLLLDAGADPNDGQALYNRMFQPDNDHLELLFEYGLGTGSGGPWRALLGEAVDSPSQLLATQLSWAIDHGFVDRVRLLAAHGVDLTVESTSPFSVNRRPAEAALLAGQPAIAEILLAAGAPAPRLDGVDELIAAALAGDRERAGQLVAVSPGVAAAARERRPGLLVWAAARGRLDAIRLLTDLGFDVNALGRGDTPVEQQWQTALHQAAGDGSLELVRLLLELGADPAIPDRRFQATPEQWAGFFGRTETSALLAEWARSQH